MHRYSSARSRRSTGVLTVITRQDNRCSLLVLGALMGSLNGAVGSVASCAFLAVSSDNVSLDLKHSLQVIKSSR